MQADALDAARSERDGYRREAESAAGRAENAGAREMHARAELDTAHKAMRFWMENDAATQGALHAAEARIAAALAMIGTDSALDRAIRRVLTGGNP